MDETSRGIATATLTLQSVRVQALVAKGVLTPGEAMEVAEKALTAAATSEVDADEQEVAEVTVAWLEHIREGLAGMASGN